MLHKDWDYRLFVQHADLYLPLLMEARQNAIAEVNGLIQIFKKYKVKDKAKVLDLFCGIGRHSLHLAKRHYEVVGYDPSRLFLSEAEKLARKRINNLGSLRFYEGDPKQVSKTLHKNDENQFNVIIIMDNCLGYKAESEDAQILADLRSLACHDCILVIQTENRDWRILNFEECVHHEFDNSEIYESWKFDLESSTSFSDSKFYKKVAEKTLSLQLRINTSLRLYSLHELKNLIERSGWTYLTNFGTFEILEPANLNSKDVITVSRFKSYK